MAKEFTARDFPPFPDGLPTVELSGISLAKLEAGDADEQERLFEICKGQGFFYLDFTGTSTESLPAGSEECGQIAEELFKLPFEEKMSYGMDPTNGTVVGYKHAGAGVTDKQGTLDSSEFFNITKNHIITDTKHPAYPTCVTKNFPQLNTYARDAHAVGLTILAILAKKLNLPADAFARLHRLDEQSEDHIRLTRGPARKTPHLPEISMAGHTDFGSVTILFNWLGGLQIYSEPARGGKGFAKLIDPEYDLDHSVADKPRWLWVKPRPGCAIVNLGDAAVIFSNGLFCSGRHRVVPAPGNQGLQPRFSVVYFVRPEDDAVLKPFDSDVIPKAAVGAPELTAREWIVEQYDLMRGKALTASNKSSSENLGSSSSSSRSSVTNVSEAKDDKVYWKGKDITASSYSREHLVL